MLYYAISEQEARMFKRLLKLEWKLSPGYWPPLPPSFAFPAYHRGRNLLAIMLVLIACCFCETSGMKATGEDNLGFGKEL
jgi:hypothetical protein